MEFKGNVKNCIFRFHIPILIGNELKVGKLQLSTFFFVDKDNSTTNQISFRHEGDKVSHTKEVYVYGNGPNPKLRKYYTSNKLHSKTKYIYDPKNRILSEKTKYNSKSKLEKKQYIYNTEGRLVKINKTKRRKLVEIEDFYYSRENYFRELLELEYKKTNRIVNFLTLNDKGIIIEEETIYHDTKKRLIVRNDSKGNVVYVQWFKNDRSFEYEKNLKYDKQERLIEESITNENGTVVNSHKFEYDNTGNWIKRTDYRDGKALGIAIREIEYFF